MSEMATEPGDGGGGMMSQKILGVPVLVWVAGAAIIAFLVLRRSSSGGSPSTSGGGGAVTTGSTRIDKGAIRVTITQGNPQPHLPHLPRRRKTVHSHKHVPPRKAAAPHPDRKKPGHRAQHPVRRPERNQ